MAAYEAEVRAVQKRIADVERELEERISAIQREAHREIVRAIRVADEELFRARLFLSSVSGNEALENVASPRISVKSPDVRDGAEVRGKVRTKSPRTSAVRVMKQDKAAPRKSVRVLLLEMLAGAEKGLPESEIDDAVLALGLTKDASRKAKGFAKRNGTIEERDGLLFITPAGSSQLNGTSAG
jgi:hypothetical protein